MATMAKSTPAGDVQLTPEQLAAQEPSEPVMLVLSGQLLEAFNYYFARQNAAKLAVLGSTKIAAERERFAQEMFAKYIMQTANATWARDYVVANNIGAQDAKNLPKHWR